MKCGACDYKTQLLRRGKAEKKLRQHECTVKIGDGGKNATDVDEADNDGIDDKEVGKDTRQEEMKEALGEDTKQLEVQVDTEKLDVHQLEVQVDTQRLEVQL